jgi:hypothetical protein
MLWISSHMIWWLWGLCSYHCVPACWRQMHTCTWINWVIMVTDVDPDSCLNDRDMWKGLVEAVQCSMYIHGSIHETCTSGYIYSFMLWHVWWIYPYTGNMPVLKKKSLMLADSCQSKYKEGGWSLSTDWELWMTRIWFLGQRRFYLERSSWTNLHHWNMLMQSITWGTSVKSS